MMKINSRNGIEFLMYLAWRACGLWGRERLYFYFSIFSSIEIILVNAISPKTQLQGRSTRSFLRTAGVFSSWMVNSIGIDFLDAKKYLLADKTPLSALISRLICFVEETAFVLSSNGVIVFFIAQSKRRR